MKKTTISILLLMVSNARATGVDMQSSIVPSYIRDQFPIATVSVFVFVVGYTSCVLGERMIIPVLKEIIASQVSILDRI